MDWYLLAVLSVFASSLTGIFRKLIGRENKSSFETIILFQLFGAFFLLAISIIRGFKMPPLAEFPLQFALVGFLWGLAMIFLFNAYKKVEASEIAVLTTFETIIVLFLGNKLLNESLDLKNFIGIIFISCSILFLSFDNLKKINFNKGFIFAILASSLAGLASINDTFLVKKADALSYLFLAYLLPGIFVYLIYSLTKRKVFLNFKNANLKYILLLVIFSVISDIPYYLALNLDGQISQVLPINKTSIIFTIILAIIFLKERKDTSKKLFCGFLAVIGVILLN